MNKPTDLKLTDPLRRTVMLILAFLFCFTFRYFTEEPHFAGSRRNNDLARHIAAKWKDYGFDQVELTRYDVLLNTPHKDLKNKVEIHRNGEVVFEAQPYEKASDTICVYFSTLY